MAAVRYRRVVYLVAMVGEAGQTDTGRAEACISWVTALWGCKRWLQGLVFTGLI